MKKNNQKIIIGHRGGANNHYKDKEEAQQRENTIDSFQKGLESGADLIECDLNITKDGIICIHHDPFIIDQTGKKLFIKNITFRELQNIKIDICSLDELFKVFKEDCFVFELKDVSNFKDIIDIFYSKYPERFIKNRFISFSSETLKYTQTKSNDIYCIYIGTSDGDVEGGASRKELFVNRKHIEICTKNKFKELAGHWLTFSSNMIKKTHKEGLNVGIGPVNHFFARRKAKKADSVYTDKAQEIITKFTMR